MSLKDTEGMDKLNKAVLAARLNRVERGQSYRERALKLYPWVCGRCAREFDQKNVRELTVHHKDHNHDNNPADGSNWELLCVYCHDEEHSRYEKQISGGEQFLDGEADPHARQTPFSNLRQQLANKKGKK